MLRLKLIIAFILITGPVAIVLGQYTGARATLEKSGILIGDQINLELNVTVPAGSKVQWPMLLDTIAANVEILRKSGIDTSFRDKEKYTLKQELLITSFDSGAYVIHPIRFIYHRDNDTTGYFTETLPVTLDVQTVKVDQAQDIKPIKPPLKAPVTFREIFPWILLGVALIGLAFLVYYYMKRKKAMPPVVTTRLSTAVPPYEAAIDALEALKTKKLWQAGQVKEYYSELTEIVREYIELRFPVRAMEMTTDEIYQELRKTEVMASSREKLNKVLTLADLVKFAKEQPLPVENEQVFERTVEFVRETKPGRDEDAVPPKQDAVVEQDKA